MATRAENQVAIANRLYEARRTLRRLLGDKYAKYAAKWTQLVSAVADAEHDGDHLRTGMRLIADLQADHDSGMGQLWIMAAVVELIEPDEMTPALEDRP